MANGCCTNVVCADRDTQLRLARLREELLTNFNTLLMDRIRFLEQTINQLSLSSSSSIPKATTSTLAYTHSNPAPSTKDRLSTPSPLRRSSSTTVYFLQSPTNHYLSGTGEGGARSCPSSVDLSSSSTDRRKRFFSSKKCGHLQNRASTESSHSNYLSIPSSDTPWSTSTNDLVSNTTVINERGRLETRRFACDVDDNEVRAFKAMIYMEQARKQHARPLTRLRQALGMSTNSNPSSYLLSNPKKHSNA